MIELYHGKDEFISFREVKKRIKELTNEIPNISIVNIESNEKSSQDIINTIFSQDMFNTYKIVLIKRLSENKEKEGLIEYLQKNISSIPKDTRVIFWEDSKIASNTKYFKLFKKPFTFDEMNKPSFYKWAQNELKDNEINCTRQTVITLCSRTDYKPERLVQELDKYILLNIKDLTEEIVIKETTDTLEEAIWNLTKALNVGTKSEIFTILDRLYKQDVDINFIISMVARNLRLTSEVKYLHEKESTNSEICSKLRIPPFTLPELLSYAKQTEWMKIKYLYEKLSSLDYEIKRGNIDANTGLVLVLNKA